MKQIAVFAVLVALVAAAAIDYEPCYTDYEATDGSYYSIEGEWKNGIDKNGNTWFFSTCQTNSNVSPCGASGVSVCMQYKSTESIEIKGTSKSFRLSESPKGPAQGFEIMYGSDDAIKPTKTVIEMTCGHSDDSVTVTLVDSTFTIIEYTSMDNCPGASAPTQPHRVVMVSGAFVYFLFLCTSLLAVCCCCTCMMRRRRTQQRKDIQMKQFSSTAFQPIPQTNTIKSTANAAAPSYNPYVEQPQFVYFYPSQNGSAPQFPYVSLEIQEPQVANDEQVARELQAKFDQE